MPSSREGMVGLQQGRHWRWVRMSARVSLMRSGALAAALLCTTSDAQAGHEVPYYPSFYPQEIRIEPLDPGAAAREFANARDPLHAYLGAAPHFPGDIPAHIKSVISLHSFITASVNPESAPLKGRDARCRALATVAPMLAKRPDVLAHAYPITPYHADYLGHIDRVQNGEPGAPPDARLLLRVRTETDALVGNVRSDDATWDTSIREVAVDELLRDSGVTFNIWPVAPWAKEGWFQAYRLLRPAVSDADDGKRADEIYGRLTDADASESNAAQRVSLERELIAALTRGCDSAVIGYRVRREYFTDDFSNGIENIAVDSQSGFNSAVVLRTLKLKDFPWNGWLRLGINAPAAAAWNPVAGFTDAPGRLVWAIVGDNAFLPIPYNSLWAPNRTEIKPAEQPAKQQSIRVPADALIPEPGNGRLAPVGAGTSAMTKVTYRVRASSFQDGTEMEAADLVYPYAFASRRGTAPDSATFDAEISAATRLMREHLKGVRIVGVEESKLPIADLVFTYRSPVVEVYLDARSGDEHQNALIAPPWSSAPWHLLALMDAAVERGLAAFSQGEARRRNLPWLDLVRDPAQRAKLRALIKEFAVAGYRPAALENLVDAPAATARWQALDQFVEANSHLLVTNGPYRLRRYAPDVYTFDVIREFTYPIGLGTFDFYAYPANAFVTRIEHIGHRMLVTAEAEIALKQQRDRRIVRVALKRDTLRETLPIRPVPRYVLLDEDGKVIAAGSASRESDGRFAVSLPPLPAGNYTFFTAVFLDGNTINAATGRFDIRSN
jgi:hypothetical protein